jgi:hypothetical protein
MAAAAASALGWLAPHLPLRSVDLEIEAWGAVISVLGIGCPLLAAAALSEALDKRFGVYLLPAAGSLLFSLGFFFAMGGAGYDDRTGRAAPIQIVFVLSTAGGALLAITSTASLARRLARARLTARAAWLTASSFIVVAALLAMIWGRAVASILSTGASSHTYYRAGSYNFFWAMVLHDTAVTISIYLLAAVLLIARRPSAPLAGFFAASYLFAHFAPAISIELYRLYALGEIDIPLLAVAAALSAAAAGSAVHIARSALLAPADPDGRASPDPS